VGAVVGGTVELSSGFYLLLEVTGQLQVFKSRERLAERSRAEDVEENLTAVFAWRPLLGVGKRF
jgi:hypothetical protein